MPSITASSYLVTVYIDCTVTQFRLLTFYNKKKQTVFCIDGVLHQMVEWPCHLPIILTIFLWLFDLVFFATVLLQVCLLITIT